MDFISDAYDIYDYRVNKINVELMESLAEFTESYGENFYITEAQKDSIYIKLKKFLADLIVIMHNFINQIKIDVRKKINEKKYDAKIRALYKEIKENGDKTVYVADVWAINKFISKAAKELKQHTKRVADIRYSNTSEIDEDINKFNKLMEKYDKELDKLCSYKVKVSAKKMLDFIEDEISGRSSILDHLNESISIIEQIQSDVKALEKRKDILGPDVIPKHIGFLRRISQKIAMAFRKWVSKVVSRIVFIFA